jgi:Domain of unknown function (DUF4157)/Lecithin retinol acyltransferase
MKDWKRRESGSARPGSAAQGSSGVDLRRAGLMRRMRQRQASTTQVPHRAEMEQRFGENFSSVQVHTGESQTMGAMGAHAAADGDHVAFAEDAPSKALVAHELAHVVQARRSGVEGGVQRAALAPDNHPAEREADRAATSVMRGEQVQIGAAPGGRVHLAKAEPAAKAADPSKAGGQKEAAPGGAKANDPFPVGSEVWVKRSLGYHHAGVYVGNNEMVHVFAEPMGAAKALLQGKPIVNVVRTPIDTFLGGEAVSKAEVGPSKDAFAPGETVQRATEHVGQAWDYNPLTHNCQHFSSKTVSGVADSPEADAIENAFLNLPAEAEHAASKLGHEAAHAVEGAASSAKKAFKKLKFW